MNIFIIKDTKCIIHGNRNFSDGLWDVKIPHVQSPLKIKSSAHNLNHGLNYVVHMPNMKISTYKIQHSINAIIRKQQTKSKLWTYLHRCCGSPAISTWRKAIQNDNFITWPVIDSLSMYTDSHITITTAKCHPDQEQKIYNLPSSSKI